jgi:hypothetical protein
MVAHLVVAMAVASKAIPLKAGLHNKATDLHRANMVRVGLATDPPVVDIPRKASKAAMVHLPRRDTRRGNDGPLNEDEGKALKCAANRA